MSEKKLSWRPGYRGRVAADAASAALDVIRSKYDGLLQPEDVVKAAKGKRHPLHPVFDWDDSEAANEWRVEQARRMMRSLMVVEEKTSEQPRRVLEVQQVPATETAPARRVYRTMEDIMADPDARAELLARALKELIAFRTRFKQLQELSVVMRAADKVLESVELP